MDKQGRFQMKFYLENMTLHQRINIKSWYGNYANLFTKLRSLNKLFFNCPAILTFCGIAQYDDPYGKHKKGARLDGVTSDSIFALED